MFEPRVLLVQAIDHARW